MPGATASTADDGETDREAVLLLQGDDGGEGSWALAGTPMRLSLAGAQDKLAVVAEADGRLRLPHRGEPSTHILKPDSRRVRASDGLLQRLHQEDFCQALGYPDGLKYEASGGPGLAACSALVRRLALGPRAVQGLLDWVIFNALIGNADAHAKNLSLLCDRDGQRRLAPLYDLVPTLYLPESRLDRTPAMRIGQASRIDRVVAEDWATFADAAGYRKSYVLEHVRSIADAILGSLADTGNDIVQQGGDPTQVARVMSAIGGNTRKASSRWKP